MDLKKTKPILYDSHIIPRVKQYLEENVHQTYVDVGLMTKTLQDRYREYSRRKSLPFRQLVEQAYKTVLHSYGLDSNPSSEENDDGSDLELMEDRQEGNHLNNIITNMYANNSNNTAANKDSHQVGNAGELIDISSDESGGEEGKTIKAKLPQVPIKKLDGKQLTTAKKTTDNNNSSNSNNSVLPENIPVNKKRKLDNDHADRLDGTTAAVTRDTLKNSKLNDNNHIARSSPLLNILAPTPKSSTKKFKKEITAHISPYTFKDIGGMDKILKNLCELLLHIKHPEVYKHIGLPPPRGFLLHGPPGCGKTLLAQAIAGQLKVGLIEIVATELVAGVSGESEERIRELFEQAALLAPCVLFIDEIDAISSNRLTAQKDMERRIVAQLLNSIDSLSNYENGDQVLIIGATNRADSLDPALRRVGRFDQEICLGIPDRQARAEILAIICQKLKLEQPFDNDEVASLTPGYVGADLLALATRAAGIAIKRAFTLKQKDLMRHMNEANKIAQSGSDSMVVNLTTDESIIMDVDAMLDALDTNSAKGYQKQKQQQPEQKEQQVNGVECAIDITEDKQPEKKTTEKENYSGNENDKKITVDEVSENNEKIDVETVEENVKPKEDTATDIQVVESDGTNKTDEIESMITDELEEKSTLNNKENTEISDPKTSDQNVAIDNEDSVEVVTQSSNEKNENKIKNNPSISDQSQTEKVEESKDDKFIAKNLDCVIDISEETLDDSVKSANNKKHNQIELDEMIKWLNNIQPPISPNELKVLNITMRDFKDALKVVQPSAKREGFITVPDVTWNDIGSLRDIRDELHLAILAPVKYPERLKILGLQARSGVLLCGPPGCGKTLLAKAVANEAGINFISVKGPELLNMYVGESERAVRQCFQRARNSAPCVIFFDEFDALCPKRSDSNEGNASSRVVNQLLTEMDGIEDRNGVFLMAATNRPDIVDPAVLRPGRLDKILYVGLPELSDRIEILLALTKQKSKPILDDDVDLTNLAELTVNYTGADLAGLVRQASLNALKDSIMSDANDPSGTNNSVINVNKKNFLLALKHIRPSVSDKDKSHYDQLRQLYAMPQESKY